MEGTKREKDLLEVMQELELAKRVFDDPRARAHELEQAITEMREGCDYLRKHGYHTLVTYYQERKRRY